MVSALCAGTLASAASAQTLDEQYRFFLEDDCRRLAFERDAEGHLLPGQTGPHLFALCAGPPVPPVAGDLPPGVSTSTNATGGGAAAAAGRTTHAEAGALRDRREQARGEDQDTPSSAAPVVDLFRTRRTAGFISLDRRYERQSVSQFESGRRAQSTAATIGADYRFGATAVVGLALSYTDQSGDFSGGGGFELQGRGIWIYGSWFLGEHGFIDVSAGTDTQDRRTRRLVGLRAVTESPESTVITIRPPLELTDGSTRSREKGVEISGGFDFLVGNMVLGPRTGLVTRRAGVAGFVEGGSTPMTLAFDRRATDSRRSSMGVQASRALRHEGRTLIAQINLDWLHEYRDHQRVITARFAEDLRPDAPKLSFLNQPPDRDWLNLRVSLVGVFSRRYSAFLSLESTIGHAYLDRYGASLGMRREF